MFCYITYGCFGLTVYDLCVSFRRLVISALNENRENDVFQIGVADAEVLHRVIVEDGLDERPPQRVHVADHH